MDETFYLAIRAVDSHGNTGELSNIVIISEAKKMDVKITEASNKLIGYFYRCSSWKYDCSWYCDSYKKKIAEI